MLNPILVSTLETLSTLVDILSETLWLLLQGGEGAADAGGDAVANGTGGTNGTGQATGDPPGLLIQIVRNPLTMITGLIFLFYIMVLVPERRRQSETNRKRSELKKNDRIVTTGGILGTVVTAAQDSDEITIRIDETTNAKMKVLRSAVATVNAGSKEEPAGK